MSEWQPIATAPKDGTAILAYGRYNQEPVTVRFIGKQWEPVYDRSSIVQYMSDFGTDYKDHEIVEVWQPLPTPPEDFPE